MARISEAPTPEQYAQLSAAMQRMADALRESVVTVLASPVLQESMEAIAAQMEPYAPLLERMTLTEAQKSKPYLCKRHHARIPAGCHCPLCITDSSHDAALFESVLGYSEDS